MNVIDDKLSCPRRWRTCIIGVKKFEPGQIIEIQRELDAQWEPATYKFLETNWHGWHSVEIPRSSVPKIVETAHSQWLSWTFRVPTRRIRAMAAS